MMTKAGSRRGFAIVAALAAVVLVAGCEEKKDRVAFDGFYFKAKTRKLGDNLADFTATVGGVSNSINGAIEAGRYEGTKYCIANYGTSRIDWTVGPDTPPEALTVVNDQITFQGRCAP